MLVVAKASVPLRYLRDVPAWAWEDEDKDPFDIAAAMPPSMPVANVREEEGQPVSVVRENVGIEIRRLATPNGARCPDCRSASALDTVAENRRINEIAAFVEGQPGLTLVVPAPPPEPDVAAQAIAAANAAVIAATAALATANDNINVRIATVVTRATTNLNRRLAQATFEADWFQAMTRRLTDSMGTLRTELRVAEAKSERVEDLFASAYARGRAAGRAEGPAHQEEHQRSNQGWM